MTTENGLVVTQVTGGETRSYLTNPNEWMGNVLATTDPVTGVITGLVGPAGNFIRAIGGPRKAAILGDSIAAQNLDISTGAGVATAYRGRGWLSWAQARLGWLWDIQIADQFAVGGTNTSAMITAQLPLLKAAHALYNYDRVFISSGTNDSNAGTALATIIEDTNRLIGEIGSLGITPVHIGVLPRAIAGGMTDAKRKNLRLNDWLANYAARTGNLEFIHGAHESVADNTAANGYCLSGTMDDYLHPNDLGGYLIGEAVYNYYSGKGLSSTLQFAQSQADQYDATYNKSGVAFDSPNPLLLGGTTAPTGMSSAGTNCTWAVGTRTLANGQTRATVQCTVAGATTNGYLYDDCVASGDWSAGDELAVGDQVYLQAIVEVVTGAAGLLPWLSLVESDGVSNYPSYCMDRYSVDIPALADGTILTLRTPNISIHSYGGSGNASIAAKLNVRGSSGVLKVRAFEVRKVVD